MERNGKIEAYSINRKRETISKGGFSTKTEATRIEHQSNMRVNVNKDYQLFINYYKNWIETYKLGVFSYETDLFYKNAVKFIERYSPDLQLKEITRD